MAATRQLSGEVHECDPSAKPCRVTATGAAYLRGYDGDVKLSDVEEQGFLAARQSPLFDRAPVDGAGPDDLDTELVDAFLGSVRERVPYGLGRFGDDTARARPAPTDGATAPNRTRGWAAFDASSTMIGNVELCRQYTGN